MKTFFSQGGCEEKVCTNYGVCEANEKSEGTCVCPEACPDVSTPLILLCNLIVRCNFNCLV